MNVRTWQFHSLTMIVLAITVVYFQAYVLSRASSPWLHIDLASIFVVYVSIEHMLLGAIVRIFVVMALMRMFSGAPDGFYLMYFLLALVISNLVSRVMALHKLSSQILVFAGILVLKYALIHSSMSKVHRAQDVFSFILNHLPSFVVTTLLSVPCFGLLSRIDGFFEFSARRDHRQELLES